MCRSLVAGNWKMHGTHSSVAELIKGLHQLALPSGVGAVVTSPCPSISQVIQGLTGKVIDVGAQSSAAEPMQGALTGETVPSQLTDVGCSMVLVGHPERRLILGKSDKVVSCKFTAVRPCGLVPAPCVGETQAECEAGKTLGVITRQLGSVIDELGAGASVRVVMTYEPVWTIGIGLTTSPAQAQGVHAAIHAQLAVENAETAKSARLPYGGSIKVASAAELFGMPDIDGGLVGGVSLNMDEFDVICRAMGSRKCWKRS